MQAAPPEFPFPYHGHVGRSSATTIERFSASLDPLFTSSNSRPIAVAIGPYHHGSPKLQEMEKVKRAALEDFSRSAREKCEAAALKILSLVGSARSCYAGPLENAEYYMEGGESTLDGDSECMLDDGESMRDGGSTPDGDGESTLDGGESMQDGKPTPDGESMQDGKPTPDGESTLDGGESMQDGESMPDSESVRDDKLAKMLFLDGKLSMCPDNPDAAPPETDLLMSRPEVHTRIDDIARDILLLENQIPWVVLEALMEMELWPAVPPVDKFLRLMASAFHIGNQDNEDIHIVVNKDVLLGEQPPNHHDGDEPPPHLLGLFYRRQVGVARTQSLRVPRLPSMSTTAVELAEMSVKLTASSNFFGDMSMSKRRQGLLSLSGELSLVPLVLNNLTACWLVNMAAYEMCLGATQADNFAVSSYISLLALLMNRDQDTQELRAKGIINSAFSDMETLYFFKWLAPRLHVGLRYYQVFQHLQEYRQERWVWIPVHRFFYKNIKTILAVLSAAGVLAGLFKAILSVKQPER